MTTEHTPHSTPTLNERKDEIVREWMDVAGEIGDFKALDGLATAFVAMERQWERTQEQYEILREALDTIATKFDKYGNEGYPAAIARQALRKVSSPAKRSDALERTESNG